MTHAILVLDVSELDPDAVVLSVFVAHMQYAVRLALYLTPTPAQSKKFVKNASRQGLIIYDLQVLLGHTFGVWHVHKGATELRTRRVLGETNKYATKTGLEHVRLTSSGRSTLNKWEGRTHW